MRIGPESRWRARRVSRKAAARAFTSSQDSPPSPLKARKGIPRLRASCSVLPIGFPSCSPAPFSLSNGSYTTLWSGWWAKMASAVLRHRPRSLQYTRSKCWFLRRVPRRWACCRPLSVSSPSAWPCRTCLTLPTVRPLGEGYCRVKNTSIMEGGEVHTPMLERRSLY